MTLLVDSQYEGFKDEYNSSVRREPSTRSPAHSQVNISNIPFQIPRKGKGSRYGRSGEQINVLALPEIVRPAR
jgi:hypothetical protein